MKRYILLLTAALSFALSSAQAAPTPARSCPAVLMDQTGYQSQIDVLNGTDWTTADGVMVTGAHLYPLDVILNGLDLNAKDLSRLHGKTVLSLAEGYSGLLPLLLSDDINAIGLDIWYNQKKFPHNEGGRHMQQYIAAYGDHLIEGDARKIPMRSESVDLVVSHQLVNNFDLIEDGIAVVDDAIRVTKIDGEIRIYGFGSDDMPAVIIHLNKKYEGHIKVRSEIRHSRWKLFGQPKEHSGVLIVIEKISSTSRS